jgi:hypothetical protein
LWRPSISAGNPRRALPLRNAQGASRKTARKLKASRRPRAAKAVRSPEEMFPEILELPFCKYVGRPPGMDQCDWWSVPVDPKDGLGLARPGAEENSSSLAAPTLR